MYTQVSRYVPFDLGEFHSNTLLLYGLRTHASEFPIPLSKVSSLLSTVLLHKNSVKFATMPTSPVRLPFTHPNTTSLE